MSVPVSTIRLQFHKDFTLDDAAGLADYFAQLGVSHVYASPVFRARSGSTHGYDVADPTEINPEIGGEPALRRLVAALRARGLGLILDIVPNHMGVGPENPWWNDMLARGPASAYAGFFDVDWMSTADPAMAGKILLPVLGEQYGEALAKGHLRLVRDEYGTPVAGYHEAHFPLRPEDASALSAEGLDEALTHHDPSTEEGRARLHALLERQHYRLAWWRTASDEINWRRFFDVNELAGLRIEQPDVYEAAHALIFRLYAGGLIDGVRIDHVDGLAEPGAYCRRLRARLARLDARRPTEAPPGPAYLVVEKILAEDEALPGDWETDGTSGYDFMDEVSAVLHDATGAEPLTELWAEIAPERGNFASEEHRARLQIVGESFTAERESLVGVLHRIARADLATRDSSLPSLRRTLAELLAHFPVYRTYAGPEGRSPTDEAVMAQAVDAARSHVRPGEEPVLDLVSRWLGGEPPAAIADPEARGLREEAIRKFQQLTSPVAAKSVEDTAFYRYGRLISRNEVGSDPDVLAIPVDEFHRRAARRGRSFPHAMLATATHDHKRGEDARARLAVLSEIAGDWWDTMHAWRRRNRALLQRADGRRAPDPIDEAMLYQTLVGAWPPDLRPDDRSGVERLAERIERWQLKAIREAKRDSRWTAPDEAYEAACTAFARELLLGRSAAFRHLVAGFVDRIGAAGAVNGLSQALLRMTAPGVPDLYQGADFWDFSLVDPDNRAPVDFSARIAALHDTAEPAALLETWQDGRVKQAVVTRTLRFRQAHAALFAQGGYEPLATRGALADKLIAFARRHESGLVVTLASRHAARLTEGGVPLIPAWAWDDTEILVPNAPAGLTDVLTGRTIALDDGRIRAADALAALPVALLAAVPSLQ